MSKELLDAIRAKDINRANKLLEQGADINFSDVTRNSPIKIAVIELHSLEMLRFLVNYKDKDQIKPLKIDLDVHCGCTVLHALCNYYAEGAYEVNIQIVALLLKTNAAINQDQPYPILKDVMRIQNPIIAEMFLYEAILRGETETYKKLRTKITLINDEKFQEHLKIFSHQYSDLQFNNVLENLEIFRRENLLSPETVAAFKRILTDYRLLLLPTEDLPKCLEQFKQKQKVTPPLSSVIASLQYHRGHLKEPGTNEELLPFSENMTDEKEEEYKERLAARKKVYDLSRLQEFVDPDLYDRQKALVELCQQQGIIDCLCQAALHPEVPQRDRYRCIALLTHYEKLEPHDRLVVYSQKIGISKLEESVAELLTLTANKITERMNSEIAILKDDNRRLSEQVGALQKMLETFISKLEPDHKPNSLLDYESQKRPR